MHDLGFISILLLIGKIIRVKVKFIQQFGNICGDSHCFGIRGITFIFTQYIH